MSQAIASDSEISRISTAIHSTEPKTALQKWQICQQVFVYWKNAKKGKENALADRKAALMRSDLYKEKYNAFMAAKRELEEARTKALEDADINRQYMDATDLKFLRSQEEGLFKPLFNKAAFVVKQDPLQADLSLFIENENEETQNRFGEHFRYTLGVEGVGRFWRGKNRKSPSEEAKEIEQLEEAAKKE